MYGPCEASGVTLLILYYIIVSCYIIVCSRAEASNIEALIMRTGLGVSYAIIIIRNPQNPTLILKALTLTRGQKLRHELG